MNQYQSDYIPGFIFFQASSRGFQPSHASTVGPCLPNKTQSNQSITGMLQTWSCCPLICANWEEVKVILRRWVKEYHDYWAWLDGTRFQMCQRNLDDRILKEWENKYEDMNMTGEYGRIRRNLMFSLVLLRWFPSTYNHRCKKNYSKKNFHEFVCLEEPPEASVSTLFFSKWDSLLGTSYLLFGGHGGAVFNLHGDSNFHAKFNGPKVAIMSAYQRFFKPVRSVKSI